MSSPEWTPAARTSTFVRTRKDNREGGVYRLPPGPANGEEAERSAQITGDAWPGMTGSDRVASDSGGIGEVSIPFSDSLADHTMEITFTDLPGQGPEFIMIVGPGIHSQEFRSVTFHAAPLETFPGPF